jgi:Arc/MetJ-type ribon-helix-helix transcriptional regulator
MRGSISGMKVSVSLPEDDVEFIDEYAAKVGGSSRSSVLRRAIWLLRMDDLERAYEGAWRDWAAGDDAELWDAAAADGIGDAQG